MPSSGISTLNQGIHGNRKTMTKFLKMNPIIFVLLLVPFQRLEFGPVLMFVLGRILTHFQECFTWPLLFQNFTELVPGTYILPNLEMFHPVSFLFRAFLSEWLNEWMNEMNTSLETWNVKLGARVTVVPMQGRVKSCMFPRNACF